MKKNIFKSILASLALTFAFTSMLTVSNANADQDNMFWDGQQANVQIATGLGNQDPREMAGNIINIILTFLGIIAVVIILIAGFKWMTAGGSEDKIEEAKKMLGAGVIGLVIILMSYALASFILRQLYNQTGAIG